MLKVKIIGLCYTGFVVTLLIMVNILLETCHFNESLFPIINGFVAEVYY